MEERAGHKRRAATGRKGEHSSRLRSLLQQLEDKQKQHESARRMRELLQKQVELLEEVVDPHSVLTLLQHMGMRAMSMPKTPVAITAPGFQPTSFAVALDALPDSLGAYNDMLLNRIACMSLGDAVHVVRQFLSSAQMTLLQTACHGRDSPSYGSMRRVIKTYTYFLMVHATVNASQLAPHLLSNLDTGEPNSVPAGWYDRVAAMIPAHKEFAQLVQSAMTLATSANSQDECMSMAKITLLLSKKRILDDHCQVGKYDSSHQELVTLDSTLRTYGRVHDRGVLFRNQIMGYLATQMMDMEGFPLHTFGHMMIACWPYPANLGQTLRAYLRRADVLALLEPASEEQPSGRSSADIHDRCDHARVKPGAMKEEDTRSSASCSPQGGPVAHGRQDPPRALSPPPCAQRHERQHASDAGQASSGDSAESARCWVTERTMLHADWQAGAMASGPGLQHLRTSPMQQGTLGTHMPYGGAQLGAGQMYMQLPLGAPLMGGQRVHTQALPCGPHQPGPSLTPTGLMQHASHAQAVAGQPDVQLVVMEGAHPTQHQWVLQPQPPMQQHAGVALTGQQWFAGPQLCLAAQQAWPSHLAAVPAGHTDGPHYHIQALQPILDTRQIMPQLVTGLHPMPGAAQSMVLLPRGPLQAGVQQAATAHAPASVEVEETALNYTQLPLSRRWQAVGQQQLAAPVIGQQQLVAALVSEQEMPVGEVRANQHPQAGESGVE